MTNQPMWLWIGGAVVAAAVALALGMPLYAILLIALVLGCPAAMYFGMRQGHGQEGMPRASDQPGEGRETRERGRPTPTDQVRR